MSFSGEERFEGGTLVGAYNGIAEDGELITFEASGVSPEGFYVLLQKDNDGLLEDDRVLQIGEFVAFGGYTANITGCTCISLRTVLNKQKLRTHKTVDTCLANSSLFQMSIWFPTLLPCRPNFVILRLRDALMG